MCEMKNKHHENCDTRDIMIQGKQCNCYVFYADEVVRLHAELARKNAFIESIRKDYQDWLVMRDALKKS